MTVTSLRYTDRYSESSGMDVLFKDDRFIAVNKPAVIGVHRSGLVRDTTTVVDAAAELAGCPVFTLHRLDRPASGVLLLALDRETAALVTPEYWRSRVSKTYFAIVRGFAPDHGEIDLPLAAAHRRERGSFGHNRTHSRIKSDEVSTEAEFKEAVTRYTTVDRFELPVPSSRYPSSRFSLVSVMPETGRFHQIRRHFARIGYPIIGDTTHGDTKTNAAVNGYFGHTRLMLHCGALSFPHPDNDTTESIAAPILDDMRTVLDKLSRFSVLPVSEHIDDISCFNRPS